MCRAVARALRPGGRFVTVNSNPAEPTVAFPAAPPTASRGASRGSWWKVRPSSWSFSCPKAPSR